MRCRNTSTIQAETAGLFGSVHLNKFQKPYIRAKHSIICANGICSTAAPELWWPGEWERHLEWYRRCHRADARCTTQHMLFCSKSLLPFPSPYNDHLCPEASCHRCDHCHRLEFTSIRCYYVPQACFPGLCGLIRSSCHRDTCPKVMTRYRDPRQQAGRSSLLSPRLVSHTSR